MGTNRQTQTKLTEFDRPTFGEHYYIFFFEPDQRQYRLAEMKLDKPPLPMNVGDLVDGTCWEQANLGGRAPFFRIRSLEHQFTEFSDHRVHQALAVHLEQLTEDQYWEISIGRKPGRAER